MSGITVHLKRYGFPVTNTRQSWGGMNAAGDVFLISWQHEVDHKARTLFLLDLEEISSRYGAKERMAHIDAMKAGAKAWAVLCEEDKTDPANPTKERIKDFDRRRVWPLGEVFTAENGWIYCKLGNPIDVEKIR